jgi:hypothetical protein
MAMDISSGNVAFGVTCPGTLMYELQKDPENVHNIKSLQTSFSKNHVTWQCPVGCKDLKIVANFIESINALEELSVLNYEKDTSILWPAIFHHWKSLKSLAIHTPPQMRPDVWTVSIVTEVADRLPQLKRLEVDVSLEEAERRIKNEALSASKSVHQMFNGKREKCSTQDHLSAIARSLSPEPSQPMKPSVLDELMNIGRLESLVINVNLQDAACVFAEKHTWNVMGTISFPPINEDPCKQLAQQIFDGFYTKSPNSALKHLELRFPRRQWHDRCQFWTLAHSVHVRMDEGVVKVESDMDWNSYLPEFPRAGILRELIDEAYAEERGW